MLEVSTFSKNPSKDATYNFCRNFIKKNILLLKWILKNKIISTPTCLYVCMYVCIYNNIYFMCIYIICTLSHVLWLKLNFHCTPSSQCVPQHGPKYHTFISCALAKVELSLYPKFPMCSPTWSQVSYFYLMCFGES
jgi:hypothetical protein